MPKFFLQIKIICILGLLFTTNCWGQQRFTCKGNFFISFSNNLQTAVYEGKIDPMTNMAVYEVLPADPMNFLLNSIGYRSTDNYIYGIKTSGQTEDLVRLDANGNAYHITTLFGLNDDLQYPAGDITPDGQYMVILGGKQFSSGGFSEDISIIDMESPDYDITTITPEMNSYTFTDVAFDPTNGQLYGFDNESNQLILINHTEGTFEAPFSTSNVADYMGALFFDVVGNLYGYGSLLTGTFAQNTLFEINKFTGEITALGEGPDVQRSDGCSCPYPVIINKIATPRQTVPCTPITYQIDIHNATGETQSGLFFEDQFPAGFNILEINTSLEGNIVSGVGTDLLLIENVVLPPDSSAIIIIAEAENGVSGIQNNQASLNGMSLLLGTTVISDDPTTDATKDATDVNITPLTFNLPDLPANLCEGDTLLIDPLAPWDVDFLWSTGSTDTSILVTETGNYSVTISSECDSIVTNFSIEAFDLSTNLPEVSQIILGDSIVLEPSVQNYPNLQFEWNSNLDNNFCNDCPSPIVQPTTNALYFLTISTTTGCESFDTTFIKVLEETDDIYMPNAFSPNENGENDIFYPQSRLTEKVLTFRVFSRWGELVFENNNVFTNDISIGWDGSFNGQYVRQGVYIYFLEIEREDGRIEIVSGDVTLMGIK